MRTTGSDVWLMQTDSASGGWMAVWACCGSFKVLVVVEVVVASLESCRFLQILKQSLVRSLFSAERSQFSS